MTRAVGECQRQRVQRGGRRASWDSGCPAVRAFFVGTDVRGMPNWSDGMWQWDRRGPPLRSVPGRRSRRTRAAGKSGAGRRLERETSCCAADRHSGTPRDVDAQQDHASSRRPCGVGRPPRRACAEQLAAPSQLLPLDAIGQQAVMADAAGSDREARVAGSGGGIPRQEGHPSSGGRHRGGRDSGSGLGRPRQLRMRWLLMATRCV